MRGRNRAHDVSSPGASPVSQAQALRTIGQSRGNQVDVVDILAEVVGIDAHVVEIKVDVVRFDVHVVRFDVHVVGIDSKVLRLDFHDGNNVSKAFRLVSPNVPSFSNDGSPQSQRKRSLFGVRYSNDRLR